jgi:3-dehydroquinate dehydratase-2
MRISLIHGPNLNLLGTRQPEIYGSLTQEALVEQVRQAAASFGATLSFQQSNHEGDVVDFLQAANETADAVLLNPAAYTHTSIAILDTILAMRIPVVEVHLSDVKAREAFRQVSTIQDAVVATFGGQGIDSYLQALTFLKEHAHDR